jgi:prepilin signal peptidase PulO-like enzyme (type II secretory pathway)
MNGADLAAKAFLLLLGPFAGDYVATFAAAWPRRPTPLVGQSRCGRCGAPIAAASSVPLASWLLKRGRRSCCGGRIPVVYPIGEAAGLVGGIAAAATADLRVGGWAFAVALTLTYVALVDLRRFSIPLWGLAALAVEAALAVAVEPTMEARLARLAAGGVLALAFETLRRLVRRGGRAGLGAGDVMLAGLLGVLVNWRLAAPMVALAALAPLAVQTIGRKSGPVPFGFWLSLAAGVCLAFAESNLSPK